jgi:hypothetical protein
VARIARGIGHEEPPERSSKELLIVAVVQESCWCEGCGKQTLHARHYFSNGFGCLLTLLTAGFFIPIWLLIGLIQTFSKPLRCQVCGQARHAGGVQALAQVVILGFVVLLVATAVMVQWSPSKGRPGGRAAGERPPAGRAAGEEAAPAEPVGIPVKAEPKIAVVVAPIDPGIPPAAAEKIPPPRPMPANQDAPFEDAADKDRQDRAKRAKSLLTMARNLEKIGNTKGALQFYAKVIEAQPGSVEAKAADKSIKSIKAQRK